MSRSNYHTTQNLYEASYLLAKGFKLTGKDAQESKTTLFFEGEGVEQEALRYYNGGSVKAKAYSDAYRTLKDYIFER